MTREPGHFYFNRCDGLEFFMISDMVGSSYQILYMICQSDRKRNDRVSRINSRTCCETG